MGSSQGSGVSIMHDQRSAGEVVTETLAYDGGRPVTAYVPPDPPEAVVFAGDGQGISQWGGFLEAAGVRSTMIVGVHGLADETARLHEYSPVFDAERFAAHEKFFVTDVRRRVRSRFLGNANWWAAALCAAGADVVMSERVASHGAALNRLIEARALDDVEAAHLFLSLGERAIGYQHLAVADADGGGIAAWPEPRATAPDPPGVHFGVPGLDLRQGVHLGGAQDHRFVIADHQHVLHGPPSAVTIMQQATAVPGIPRRRPGGVRLGCARSSGE